MTNKNILISAIRTILVPKASTNSNLLNLWRIKNLLEAAKSLQPSWNPNWRICSLILIWIRALANLKYSKRLIILEVGRVWVRHNRSVSSTRHWGRVRIKRPHSAIQFLHHRLAIQFHLWIRIDTQIFKAKDCSQMNQICWVRCK